jgi:hypothetical protein
MSMRLRWFAGMCCAILGLAGFVHAAAQYTRGPSPIPGPTSAEPGATKDVAKVTFQWTLEGVDPMSYTFEITGCPVKNLGSPNGEVEGGTLIFKPKAPPPFIATCVLPCGSYAPNIGVKSMKGNARSAPILMPVTKEQMQIACKLK